MKSPWFRAFLLSLSLLAFSTSRALAWGHGSVAETVYTAPVATTYVEPTAYVVPTVSFAPTAYIYPTAYIEPTSYVPTSYVTPTSYVATSYVMPAQYVVTPTAYLVETSYRRRLLGPRQTIVETAGVAYVPTVAYSPTVLVDQAVVPTSATVCCNPQPICCATTPTAPVAAPAPKGGETRSTELPPAETSSVPANEPPYRPAPGAEGGSRAMPEPTTPAPAPAPPTVPESGTPPAPTAPAPENTGQGGIQSAPGRSTEVNPPTPVPPVAGEPAAPVAPVDDLDAIRREARKPVIGRTGMRNILEGKVVSRTTKSAEEGVRIIISSRTGAFEDRVTTTDAYGRYAIHLPDGDWSVKVQMPSGRIYPASGGEITVTEGQIRDSLGRQVPSLIITR
jgi:hypothetical protein